MSEEQESARDDGGTREAGVRGFASSALLVGAVGAVLLAGWSLRGSPTPPPAAAAPEVKLGKTVPVEAAPPPPVEAAVTVPEVETPPPAPPRAAAPVPAAVPVAKPADDAGRLAATGRAFTAQLLVACRADTVDRLRAEARGADKLYVLPATVHGSSCWRVCWGAYGSAKEASAAADLPKALRGKEHPGAVEIAKVLP
ncbi:MAG TPA: hypothetical protein VFV19_02185 [Candidatus Polarisedimenticolaceae bacterium]|nr:hypothetical protein [Candidatus Polarisedimenticolaceae bacterium]